MSKKLEEIAQQLKDTDKKVQLVYAFNGSGKTRLSREFKKLIAQKIDVEGDSDDSEQPELSRNKFLYYNAFTEDLFYWDNDLTLDAEPKLKIQPNSFTDWILKDQGKEPDIVANFQHYATDKITPVFNVAYQSTGTDGEKIDIPENSEITFRMNPTNTVTEDEEGIVPGDEDQEEDGKASVTEEEDQEDGASIVTEQYEVVKISKGEESNFIWSVFVTLIEQVVAVLNEPEGDDPALEQFKDLEYVFLDDPVSSLDENHLIELAVRLAELIGSSKSDLKFVITTHSPLFYNVLYNEINNKTCYLLEKHEDGTFTLLEKHGDSNQSFSYHLHLKNTLEKAIADNKVEKYHFTMLRNLYEKTASFLGYKKWGDLLDTVPGDKDAYLKRIITFSSHRTLSNEEVREPTDQEKQTVKLLLDNLKNYGYFQEGAAQ